MPHAHSISVVGLNHRTAPVQLREKLAFSKEELPDALHKLKSHSDIHEAVILSTCNRVEVYAYGPKGSSNEQIVDFLERYQRLSRKAFSANLYHFQESDAIHHLFKVSASLDSMVIGEPEIVGQVKEAYQSATQNEMCGKVFHHIFQKAFQAAKFVRTHTWIAQGSVSVSSIAVALARKTFGDLLGKEVLIVGTGKMSNKTIRLLTLQGIGKIMVVSRSGERARKYAEEIGGLPVGDGQLLNTLVNADIVITSSSANQFLIRRKDIVKVLRLRGKKPLLIIDLGVPRNVDPTIGELKPVTVFDIDHLAAISEENAQLRLRELHSGLELVEERAGRAMEWVEETRSGTQAYAKITL